jgi:signal transduction histidine kinase
LKPHSPAEGRVPRALFALALVLLALMAGWWFWFMAHAVREQDRLWRASLELEARLLAASLAHSDLVPGPLALDPRFEVVPARAGAAPVSEALSLVPSAALLGEHDKEVARRRLMVHGEGSLLLILVMACVGMLYRLILAEQRYRRDVDLFLSRVTHEMKTPLAGIKALLQTLRDGRAPPERVREICELGLRQAEREEHLIENLLMAHRLSTRQARLDPQDVDLHHALGEFAAHRAASMGATAESHVVSCPQGLVARAHPGALQTILENLADNAFKYGARTLRLRAEAGAGRVSLVLEDDGEGFDPARAETLFAPFHRDNAARTGRHGTGLGLSIARALAREMGGDLVAASDGAGRGARFTLTLPRSAARGPGNDTRGAPDGQMLGGRASASDDSTSCTASSRERRPTPQMAVRRRRVSS